MSSDTTSKAQRPARPRSLGQRVRQEAKEWGTTLAVFVPLFFMFTLLAYEQRVIPSESMVPALRVGDRVAVAKFAYGYGRYSVPWGLGRVLPLGEGRLFARDPERGDVVVFQHPHHHRVMIKRAIGLPGDTVELRDEWLYINGEPVETEFQGNLRYVPHSDRTAQTARVYEESIDGTSWLTHQWARGRKGDSTPEFRVPEGHILFMGDNRDHSMDGRDLSGHCAVENGVVDEAGCMLPPGVAAADASIGFVPMDHLIGRAETVIFSTYRCRNQPGVECLPGRLWKGL